MQQRNGRWLKPGGWQKSLEEIRRFLDTWYFYISVSGHLYVRPCRDNITGRDMHAFLRRLDALGKAGLPESMTFDFKKAQLPPRRLRRITEIIRQYAEQIDSASLVIIEIPPSGGIALIPRSIGQLDHLSQHQGRLPVSTND